MKKLILPLFSLITCAATAQFSIVPQVGMETFRTTIKQGDFSSFSPLGQQFAPSLSVRMAYKLKSGLGAFLGVATNSPAVEFKFTDLQTPASSYTASAKDLQLRLEAGYQFTSKPITLRKSVSASSYAGKWPQASSGGKQGGCARKMCGRMNNSASRYSNTSLATAAKDNGLFMRIKPSVGLALAPTGSKMETETKAGQTSYIYKSGWNTALIAGTAFEFGTRNQSRLIVSISYLKGLGNNTQTLTNSDALKPTVTTLSSKTSGFNIGLGIPLSFSKKTPVIQNPPIERPSYRGRCQRYRTYEL